MLKELQSPLGRPQNKRIKKKGGGGQGKGKEEKLRGGHGGKWGQKRGKAQPKL